MTVAPYMRARAGRIGPFPGGQQDLFPVLTTERLTMRPPQLADFETYAAFYASDRAEHIGGPLNLRSAWNLFLTDVGTWATFGFGFWMVEHEGQLVGQVGLHHPPHHAELELGWNLYAGSEGKGIAREAAEASREWARAHLPGQRLVSYIDRANTRSIALAERMGASDIGTAAHDDACGTWLHPEGAA